MTQLIINVGLTANDNTGDTLRDAFVKTNDNFTEIYTNYVSGLTAGTGISISGTPAGGWSPTITNTAPNVTTDISITHVASSVTVNSSDGADGTINAATTSLAGVLTAADKTKLDGIATGAEVNQNAFSNVAVSGQTTVAADAKTDTLTFIAGSNVTITTDAVNDSITIASATAGDGTLSIATKTAGATNTDVTLNLSGAYSANTTNNRTINAVVGPALTALATTMTGAGTGFLRKNGADTYTVDTNTYLTAEADTLATVTGRGATTATAISLTNTTESSSISTGALIVSGGIGVAKNLYVGQTLYATAKSFLISHPTKPGKKLRYGSLEGPENGVYVRGKLKGTNVIELPEYWTKLVDPDSITVQLTPIGKHQNLYVEDVVDNKVIIRNGNLLTKEVNCYYTVFAERIDVEKLEVEIE